MAASSRIAHPRCIATTRRGCGAPRFAGPTCEVYARIPLREEAEMPHKMTETEAWEFVRRGSLTATFASVRADGRPHAVPTWYAIDGDEVVFTTWHGTVKAANIRRNASVVVLVQDPEPPYSYVSV